MHTHVQTHTNTHVHTHTHINVHAYAYILIEPVPEHKHMPNTSGRCSTRHILSAQTTTMTPDLPIFSCVCEYACVVITRSTSRHIFERMCTREFVVSHAVRRIFAACRDLPQYKRLQAYTSIHIQRHASQKTDLFRVSPPPRSRNVIRSSAKTSFTSPISAIVVCISADTLAGRRGVFPRAHLNGQGGAPMHVRLTPRLEHKTLCRTYGNASHEEHRLAAIIRDMHRIFRMILCQENWREKEKVSPAKIPFTSLRWTKRRHRLKGLKISAHTQTHKHTNTRKHARACEKKA